MSTSPTDPLACDSPLDVAPEQRPRHIAMIMDGNGRWARERDLPRIEGHREGARTVRTVITTCAHLGIEALTLFSFSSENWKRPIDEVAGLMALYLEYLAREREELLENNIQFHQIGRREGLPDEVLDAADAMTEATSHCTGLKLVLALNYGSRAELTDAVRDIATAVQSGEMTPGDIDEQVITDHLYTAGLPDPDLLVRTAGERRVSNYLLWQISYAEIYVTDVYWPDFGVANLHDSIRDYARRNRRYGALDHTNT